MEPFDLETKDVDLRFESDGTAILTETGSVPRLATAKNMKQSIGGMLSQVKRGVCAVNRTLF
jgi:hypothetical protein